MKAQRAKPSRGPRSRRRPRSVILALEQLETRAVPATITVNSSIDSDVRGDEYLSLREAIGLANGELNLNDFGGVEQALVTGTPAANQQDTINFGVIDGLGPYYTIVLAKALPAITDQVTIDGYSQTGASVNTKALRDGDNAVLHIQLDGINLTGGSTSGLKIQGGTGTVIKGLAISNFTGPGIEISTNDNVIAGNFIGTDPTGKDSQPNGLSGGVLINEASGNIIGGTTLDARNVISGNTRTSSSSGVYIEGAKATNNRVRGTT
jgi:hypothetical protein